jgi:cyanophycinase-like exopeptidase
MAGGRGARLRAAVQFAGMRRSAPCAPWRAARALLPALPTGASLRALLPGAALAVGGACAAGAEGGATSPPSPAEDPGYTHRRLGSLTDVARTTTPGYLLMGGGADVDDAMRWLLARAGGGDVLVLRATGTDAYNPYLAALAPVNAVATLVLRTPAASSHPFVLEQVRRAEAIFLAGGDQGDYVRQWKDTPLAEAIRAVLGEIVYAALGTGAVSATVLANPFDASVTLERGMLGLPGLEGILTDSHFGARDRMGRLVAFLARVVQQGWASEGRGLGVDERTAVLLDAAGRVTVMGSGGAYFVRAPPALRCVPGAPLETRGVDVYRVASAGTFDLRAWHGTGGTAYRLATAQGALTSDQPGGGIY